MPVLGVSEMRRRGDLYEVLGLPPSATQAEIKRRYRQLAKRFHPDVAEDKSEAHARFVEIARAYHVLADPRSRATYDERIRQESPERPERRHRRGRSLLMVEAQALLSEGRHAEAMRLCEKLAASRPEDPEVFCLMGDIAVARGDPEGARLAYQEAIRLEPHHPAYRERLLRLSAAHPTLARGSMKQAPAESPARPASPWPRRLGLAVGWAVVVALLAWAALQPGEPGMLLGVPRRLVPIGLLDAVLLGLMLCASGVIRSFDSEMMSASVHRPAVGRTPLAVLLAPAGVIFIGLAFGIYVTVAAMEDRWSPSVLVVFAASLALAAVLAALSGGVWRPVLVWGSGPVFSCMCAGWAVGDLFRARWWD
jgi:hypothetical protein